jgi:monoterpene epsilon-lactone hydrolase
MHLVALVLRTTRRRHWETAEAGRRRIRRPKVETPPSRRLRRASEVAQRTVGGFPVWTVRPRTPSGTAAVYLHGGAYVSGIAPQHWALIGRLTDAGVRVEVPLYGLAPQHSSRDAYPFVREVWTALAAQDGEVVLAGDSAGGALALGLAQQLVSDGGPLPDRLVLLSPWLDLTLSSPAIAEYERRDPWLARPGLVEAGLAWADGDDPTSPPLSPGGGPLAGLPPITLFVGNREIGYPDAAAFAAAAVAADVDVELVVADGAVHCYPLVPAPEGAEGARAVTEAVAGLPTSEVSEDGVPDRGRRRGRWR